MSPCVGKEILKIDRYSKISSFPAFFTDDADFHRYFFNGLSRCNRCLTRQYCSKVVESAFVKQRGQHKRFCEINLNSGAFPLRGVSWWCENYSRIDHTSISRFCHLSGNTSIHHVEGIFGDFEKRPLTKSVAKRCLLIIITVV